MKKEMIAVGMLLAVSLTAQMHAASAAPIAEISSSLEALILDNPDAHATSAVPTSASDVSEPEFKWEHLEIFRKMRVHELIAYLSQAEADICATYVLSAGVWPDNRIEDSSFVARAKESIKRNIQAYRNLALIPLCEERWCKEDDQDLGIEREAIMFCISYYNATSETDAKESIALFLRGKGEDKDAVKKMAEILFDESEHEFCRKKAAEGLVTKALDNRWGLPSISKGLLLKNFLCRIRFFCLDNLKDACVALASGMTECLSPDRDELDEDNGDHPHTIDRSIFDVCLTSLKIHKDPAVRATAAFVFMCAINMNKARKKREMTKNEKDITARMNRALAYAQKRDASKLVRSFVADMRADRKRVTDKTYDYIYDVCDQMRDFIAQNAFWKDLNKKKH